MSFCDPIGLKSRPEYSIKLSRFNAFLFLFVSTQKYLKFFLRDNLANFEKISGDYYNQTGHYIRQISP